MSAWRGRVSSENEDLDQQSAIDLARGVGAGQLLTGSIVGSESRIVVRGTLLSTERPDENFQVSVEGPADSVFVFLPRFVGQLLAQSQGVDIDQSGSLTTNSLPALRAYLRGQAAYRRARYGLAVNRFTEALEADSNFALAGAGLLKSNGWTGGLAGPRVAGIASRAAWRHRDVLGFRDRAIVLAILGSNGPDPESSAERLQAQEEAIRIAGDREEAWYFLGDTYFHYGLALGIEDHLDRADAAFRRAMARDSSVAGVLQHLLLYAAMRHDTAEVYRFLALHEAAMSDSVRSLPERWFAATAVGDAEIRDAALAMLDTVEPGRGFPQPSMFLPFRPDLVTDVRDYLDRVHLGTVTQTARKTVGNMKAAVSWDAGRPGDAIETLRPYATSSAKLRVFAGLFWSGDLSDAEAAYQDLASGGEQFGWDGFLGSEECAMGVWRLEHEGVAGVDEAIGKLRATAAGRDATWPPTPEQLCALVLEAIAAEQRGDPNAATLIDALDRDLLTGPTRRLTWENLAVARLLERQGEYERAAEAAGRFVYYLGYTPFLATHFRQSGRLYDLAGNREKAIEQYSNYLMLRKDHEPALAAEVNGVRDALARLTGEGN